MSPDFSYLFIYLFLRHKYKIKKTHNDNEITLILDIHQKEHFREKKIMGEEIGDFASLKHKHNLKLRKTHKGQ